MSCKIVIVDYGMGNLFSVRKKLYRLHANAVVSSSPSEIAGADKIILPGVGHFQKAMENLVSSHLMETIQESVLVKKKPILGICLGMQLMAKKSEEGNVGGMGWFDAEVVRFSVQDTLKNKIPHMGWNQISIVKDSALMKNIPNLSEFYFVHSFHFKSYNKNDVLNVTDYDYNFVSAVEKENIFGVQYHPEKSHDVGAQLLKNYIDL